ncbi:MAG TPA: tyrosine--tRNA ligase [Gemmatimonadaceae bacterium]|nr:tyrosine--tRNA ligase [Gemmatimonadaceae bacterium]
MTNTALDARMTTPLLDELAWRGLLYQKTDGLDEYLARVGSMAVYCGFDPTASSLHVGNLVPVMGLVHTQRAGHRPYALVGGGTGMIGDPSGRASERQLLDLDQVAANVRGIASQLERFLDFSGANAARVVDNAEWLTKLGAIEFMRDVGKHFTVNVMLAKESVRSRLDAGISYTEFSYMLLQAYDFLELHRRHGVTVQAGGSDQWGNMTMGTELIRRTTGGEAHVLTFPLVTTSSGAKFGKSEGNAIWLDPALTSPYRFYQFWVNTDDRDVGRYVRYFTLIARDQIEALERSAVENPAGREAQRALAFDVTARVHGEPAARIATEVSTILFGGGDPSALSLEALDALRNEVPFAEVDAPAPSPDGTRALDVLDLLVAVGLVPSKGAGRRLLEQGGIYVNGRRLAATERMIGEDQLLVGRYLLLRKGAREYGLVKVR